MDKMESIATNELDVMSAQTEELLLKNKGKENIPLANYWGKIKHVISSITVEPVLIFFIMPSVLATLAIQNLNLDKACRVNLEFGDEVCTALSLRKRANYTFQEDEVQKLIASVQSWKSVIHTIVPSLLLLFIGAWSDKTGKRKICMLMPIFGEFMTCVLNIVNTYFFYQVPVELTVFMEVIFPSLTGGWYTMFLGTYSYLGDITSKSTRTFRLGILSLCMTVGFPFGMSLSGVLLKTLGFYGVFAISGFFQFINFFYVFFFIEDHTWLADKNKDQKTGCGNFFIEFFDFQNLRETWEITLKKGENNRRLKMCLILCVVFLTFGPMFGEFSVVYIFTRYRFNWDEVAYSIYNTYNLVVHSLGTLFTITVFSKKMQMDDAMLGVASTSSKICGALVVAFARNTIEAYLGPLVEILNGASVVILRSIASKLVSQQELGKVFSLFGLVETMVPLLFVPLYTKVYVVSLHLLPGAVFLLTVMFTIPAWFYYQHRKDRREKREDITFTPVQDDGDELV